MSYNKIEAAKKVYNKLCNYFDNKKMRYRKDDNKLLVHVSISGDDFPMDIAIVIDEERQLIRLYSPFPFKVPDDKRLDVAIASCASTYAITEGCFDYDISKGTITFRMTASFLESEIGENLFIFMVAYSGKVVDKYNDKLFALSKGLLSISDYLESI